MNVPSLTQFTAPFTDFATRTAAVGGVAAAALSPVAIAANQGVGVDVGTTWASIGLAALVGGTAAYRGVQKIQARFADEAKFEARKQTALSRILPSLDGVALPKRVELVALPAGEFTMEDKEAGRQHVVLSAFYLAKGPVLNIDFKKLEPHHNSGELSNAPHMPVVNVTHQDALDYADWMNQNHGVDGMVWRLPTEAEMAYAILSQYAADHKNQNELIDFGDSIWNWCLDRFGSYSTEPVINPRGSATGDQYVLRGGSCGSGDRLAARSDYDLLDNRYFNFGIRLVLAPVDRGAH